MCRTFFPFTDMMPDKMHSCWEKKKKQKDELHQDHLMMMTSQILPTLHKRGRCSQLSVLLVQLEQLLPLLKREIWSLTL